MLIYVLFANIIQRALPICICKSGVSVINKTNNWYGNNIIGTNCSEEWPRWLSEVKISRSTAPTNKASDWLITMAAIITSTLFTFDNLLSVLHSKHYRCFRFINFTEALFVSHDVELNRPSCLKILTFTQENFKNIFISPDNQLFRLYFLKKYNFII